MPLLHLLITRPFEPPLPGAALVVFSDTQSFVPAQESNRWLHAARRYAKKYRVWVVPGRFAAQDQLASCLISPGGEVVGGQRAIHLKAAHRGRFFRCEELNVFETPYGKIFLAVDADLLHPEVLRAAALEGARLIIGGLYLEGGDYDPMQGICGAYAAALENGVFVLDANNLVTSLCAPGAPDGWLLRDSDQLPQLLTLNLEEAPGFDPHRRLDEGFYLRHTKELGR